MKNSLSDYDKAVIRKAYLIGQNDMFTDLNWDRVYAIVSKAMDIVDEGEPSPEETQAADAGDDSETVEGATAVSD